MNKFKQYILATGLSASILSLPTLLPFASFAHFQLAYAADKIPIAVLDFQAKGEVSADEASIISDRIRSQLFRSGKYQLMERADMLAILKEQGFQQTQANCEGTNCSVELGKILAVHQFMTGTVSKLGSLYTLTFRIVDVEKGEIIIDEYQDCRCSLEDVLTRLSVEMVAKLTGNTMPAVPTVKNRPTPPVSALPRDTSLEEVAKLSIAARQRYYQEHTKAPALAMGLNFLFPLFPLGYGYAGDWGTFWSMTTWQVSIMTGAILLAASDPDNTEERAPIAGLGVVVAATIWIYSLFDVWGTAEKYNQNLRQQLKLTQKERRPESLSYGRTQIPMVPLYQQRLLFNSLFSKTGF